MAVKVGLVQINNSFSGQNYLPYSAGILQAYAQAHLERPEDYEFLLPVYQRTPVDEAVLQLAEAEAVFFSSYVWNIRLSLAIAEALKQRNPEVLTVFGGPQVPDRGETFLRQNTSVDLACHNEGEQAFLSILENFPSREWTKVPSLSFLDQDLEYRQTPRVARLKDLSVIPSPYLGGVFDDLMERNPGEQWLALWETNRGCPFSCTFCDWGSAIASKVYRFDIDTLYAELEWFAAHEIEFIFCADANFGILPRDLDLVKHVAEVKARTGYPHALSVQNTKNATERAYEVQKRLAAAGLNKGVTIAFQSLDSTTLDNIKRGNISLDSYRELQRRFTIDGIETYNDMLLGLPGETYESFADGVSSAIENGQHNRIQFGNLSILPNAEMADPVYRERYGTVTVESKAVIYHGVIAESVDGVDEMQELVVATNTMPPEDWVRTRAFCWVTALMHFDKIIQIPLILLHEACGIPYRQLLSIFSEMDDADFPVIEGIRSTFIQKAREIQAGGEEYCPAQDYLNIWWPADEFVFIELARSGRLERFYEEAERLLVRSLSGAEVPRGALRDAFELNRSLIKMPFQTEDLEIALSTNESVLKGVPIPLERTVSSHRIDRTTETWSDWNQWYREVVWYGNKKGAYLYGHSLVEAEIEGHF